MPEGKAVQSMFAGIAGRYDFANRLLSGGMDVYWRWRLVRKVKQAKPQRVVDLATGSGDVAFAIARDLPADTSISGLDFCEPMLEAAREKQNKSTPVNPIEFTFGDCLNLPLPDQSVDVITISFGYRNLEDRQAGLKEMARVLKPNGKLLILEFTQPWRWFCPIYYFYLKNILPTFARWATGNRDAYDYLAGSIESFPTKDELSAEITQAGFSSVSATGLNASIVAIHEASPQ